MFCLRGLHAPLRSVPWIFFKAAVGCGEIRPIHQRDGRHIRRQSLQQRRQQHFVDAAQASDSKATPELVQHAHVRNSMSVGQVRKLTPSPLLGQHLNDEIHRMSRGQQNQLMDSPQLRGAEVAVPAAGAGVRPLFYQKRVGDEGREFLKQCIGTGCREWRFHAPNATQKILLRPYSNSSTIFSS